MTYLPATARNKNLETGTTKDRKNLEKKTAYKGFPHCGFLQPAGYA